MFRIGEFSKLTQVSIRMLRYYDEMGLLKPAEVDKWTGHRLYSVEQIPRLNKILYLRDSGLNVSEIALALTMDDKPLLTQLDEKRIEIENAIQAEREKLRKIELAKVKYRVVKENCTITSPLSRSPRIRCCPCGKLYQPTIPRATYGKSFLLLQVRKK